MRKFTISLVLLVSIIFMLMGSVTAQEVPEKEIPERVIFFSTEEDFVTYGPLPPDGDQIISDGDLLRSDGYVYARNYDLLRNFDVKKGDDLGLDAADVIDMENYLVAFSTELDSPNRGQFTAGDLLVTGGKSGMHFIIPNIALTHLFGIGYDIGLDAVHFIGKPEAIIRFLEGVKGQDRKFWLESPKRLIGYLREFGIDIWFSTEGTQPPPPDADGDGVADNVDKCPDTPAWTPVDEYGCPLPPEKPEKPQEKRFLDGDLLSAATGNIVFRNADLLPPSVPAGIRDRGVDFGLDAFTADRDGNKELIYFSTEILYEGEPSFTDGDVLRFGNGVVITNRVLMRAFEPKTDFLGLDALSIPMELPRPCEAVIIRVGGMAAGSINLDGLANGSSATAAPFEAFDSPFGGWVEILGRMPSCEECVKFKVEYGEWPDPATPPTTFHPLTDKFEEWVWWPLWQSVNRVPDSNGWLDILCHTVMGGLYFPWNTAGKNGKYSLRLTIEDAGGIQHVSSPVVVMIDNERPKSSLDIDVVPVCGDIFVGDKVTGTITGTDAHFYSYQLRYESSLASGLILPVRKYTGVGDTGDTNVAFTWDTKDLPPCGYRIILEVWDRTIVNNYRSWGEPGYGWWTPDQFYFCLESAE